MSGVLLLALFAAACGGGEAGSADGSATPAATPAPEPAAAAVEDPLATWPPVDEALAAEGDEAFRAKGCVACHTFGGGRLVGPDLQGVAQRRARDWVAAMITHPDSMVRDDPVAKKLYAEYMTPMSNQQVTPDQLEALLALLRRESGP